MADLFGAAASADGYDASNIEVLEGLEPVRHRPGMYIGGTDERALHHLAAEILDNSMDEAVAGHADWIEMNLESRDRLTIRDNGRGMPVGEHPKFPGKSAVEVILTTLHAGGKFSGKAYATSGGLHGVGSSVVNALSERLVATVKRDGFAHRMQFRRGRTRGRLERMATWYDVERALRAGHPFAISIRAEEGELANAPYPRTSGHLLVVCGLLADGGVAVRDPAASPPSEVPRTYTRADLQRVWLERNGVAYVLTGPR